ncbi:hypothetical protein B0J11DRAFT_491377 [Dendryphion nanum]|uniref:Rhodopsin domain-containing protein n=1 Tax=Dendryphion nanum TaxID=256645 RepID=A0A9P9DML2_9PLEO|nr:hypothetical protein B0J11DRAFT_491377 [Dendryphion nanum]
MAACAAALTLTELPEGYQGYLFENTAIAFIVLSTVFVALRFYARYVANKRIMGDDLLLIAALIGNYGLCGVSIAMVRKAGIGHHTLWLCVKDPMALVLYMKLQIPFTITVAIPIAFAKIAILYMFLRIFIQPLYRYASFTLMAIQAGALIATIITSCTVCTPIQYLWDPLSYPDGHCIDLNAFWRWANFPQILTDVAILILPLPALWQLNLSKRDKVGVVITFCTGSIGLVTSIVRFIFFMQIDGQTDGAWVAVRLGCVSIAECSIYIIAACLPVYRSLLRNIKNRSGSSLGKKGYSSGSRSKDTELRSIGKHEKGFSKLGDSKPSGIITTTPDSSSDFRQHVNSPNDIKVQRQFYVTTTSHQEY